MKFWSKEGIMKKQYVKIYSHCVDINAWCKEVGNAAERWQEIAGIEVINSDDDFEAVFMIVEDWRTLPFRYMELNNTRMYAVAPEDVSYETFEMINAGAKKITYV